MGGKKTLDVEAGLRQQVDDGPLVVHFIADVSGQDDGNPLLGGERERLQGAQK